MARCVGATVVTAYARPEDGRRSVLAGFQVEVHRGKRVEPPEFVTMVVPGR